MKYLCLIYLHEAAMDALPQREWDALLDDCDACVEALQRGGRYLAGAMLQPVHTATTARVRNGRLSTTDGPFAETREQLAGFCLIDAGDLTQALVLAASMPPARYGCVEVRPVRALERAAATVDDYRNHDHRNHDGQNPWRGRVAGPREERR